MVERTSTCDPHIERETLQVYLYTLWALSFVSGCGCLNQHLPQCWIRRMTAEDQVLLHWPPGSPDLMPCNFFMGYIKDSAFLPQDLPELWRWIIAAISGIDCDVLQWVWVEMDYQLDVCRITEGGHIEHLWGVQKSWRVSLYICRSHFTIHSAIQVYRFYEMCQEIMNNLYLCPGIMLLYLN
jgi:hypothetical protein